LIRRLWRPIVTFELTGLPNDNDQFGPKYIKATLPGYNAAESVEVKLFYNKYATNHPGGGIGSPPNWYYYWGQGQVVPDLVNPLLGFIGYDDTLSIYGITTNGIIIIGPLTCTIHYNPPLGPIDGQYYGGPQTNGIDCTAEVVAHERFHEWVWNNWQLGGIWYPWTPEKDMDGDMLENTYEALVCGTDSLNSDTKNMAQFGWDILLGDQEYMGVIMGDGVRGIQIKDWSAGNYSKQWP
jgi:hypothetical protein